MTGSEYQSLLSDMRWALRSEFGARAVYPALAFFARDDELKGILGQLHEEETEQVEKLRRLMRTLGERPARGRFRRRVAAWGLAALSFVLGMRLGLRICHDAEGAVSRWYHEYAEFFAQRGEVERAEFCQELSLVKRRHAQILETWIENLPHRRTWG